MRNDATTGVAWIHRANPALVPHLTWAFARAGMARADDGGRIGHRDFGMRPAGDPAAGDACLEVCWSGHATSAADLAAELSRWPDIDFEIAVDPPAAGEAVVGKRFLHTPALGTAEVAVDAYGAVLADEFALRAVIARNKGDAAALASGIEELLCGPWDEALEPLRPGTAGHEPPPADVGRGVIPGGEVVSLADVLARKTRRGGAAGMG